MALPRKPAAAAVESIDFGSDTIYVAGSALPEGDYIITNPHIMMHQSVDKTTGANRGVPRLGVMITFLELDNPDPASGKDIFYSMGSKANLSFMPNEAGTGLAPIPNAVGTTLPPSTNWAALRKSLKDCGLPEGIFTNDISVLDGTWVHMTNVPEPEERKGFASQAATGEAAASGTGFQARTTPGTISVVSEIKEDGKPWEGTGGIPEAAPAKPAAAAKARVNGKAPAAAAPAAPAKPALVKKQAAPPPPAAEETDIATVAVTEIANAIEAKGGAAFPKVQLRPAVFKLLKAGYSEEMASAVIDAYFTDDDALNEVLNSLNYGINGAQIAPLEG